MAYGSGAYGPGQGVRHAPARRNAVRALVLSSAALAALAAVIAGSAVARPRRWLALPESRRSAAAALAFFSTPFRPGEHLSSLRRPRCAAGLAARLRTPWLCAAATPAGDAELDDLDSFELEFAADGVLEDDWSAHAEEAEVEAPNKALIAAESPDFEGQTQLMQELGITDPEELALTKEVAKAMDEGRNPDLQVLERLKAYEPEDQDAALAKMFSTVGGGSGDKWKWVPLNDTLILFVAQVPNAADMLTSSLNASKAPEIAFEEFVNGYSISPAATILARWLAIHPPLVPLDGKSVIELGAGCGFPGITAARLGAARVLLQDRDVVPLREALESAVETGIAEKVWTMTVPFASFPTRLLAGVEEALLPFQTADIILASDVIVSEAVSDVVAEVLSQLLRTSDQVAYVAEFYKGVHRKYFVRCCRSNGLAVKDQEIATWEPAGDNPVEAEEDWFIHLLTIRRI